MGGDAGGDFESVGGFVAGVFAAAGVDTAEGADAGADAVAASWPDATLVHVMAHAKSASSRRCRLEWVPDPPGNRSLMPVTRRHSVVVLIGPIKMGSAHPIVVQSMTNTDTADIEATAQQVKSLALAG